MSAELLDRLETEVMGLAEHDGLTVDDACLLLVKIDAATKRAKELKVGLEKFLIDWLPSHGNEMVVGDVVYFVGPKKKVKCRNIHATVDALYRAAEGDESVFCDVLSSSAIKIGAARKLLGDAKFEELFETVIEQDLEHKPVKALQSFNTKFIK